MQCRQREKSRLCLPVKSCERGKRAKSRGTLQCGDTGSHKWKQPDPGHEGMRQKQVLPLNERRPLPLCSTVFCCLATSVCQKRPRPPPRQDACAGAGTTPRADITPTHAPTRDDNDRPSEMGSKWGKEREKEKKERKKHRAVTSRNTTPGWKSATPRHQRDDMQSGQSPNREKQGEEKRQKCRSCSDRWGSKSRRELCTTVVIASVPRKESSRISARQS